MMIKTGLYCLFFLFFSLSMIARDFMAKYGDELTGATICGTPGVFPVADETLAKIDRLMSY